MRLTGGVVNGGVSERYTGVLRQSVSDVTRADHIGGVRRVHVGTRGQ